MNDCGMNHQGYRPWLIPGSRHNRTDGCEPVGLVAGWGRFPVQVAETLLRAGVPVHCIAIHGHADHQLEYLCSTVKWSGIGKLGAHVRYFKKHGIRRVTMAGKLFKADILYQGSLIWRHMPDLTCLRTFGPLLLSRRANARDDSLLTAVTEMYIRHQMNVVPATDLAPQLLIGEGPLTQRRPTPKVEHDMLVGWQIAKQMGGLDIGQCITIKDGTVLAVEAIEGTDACIERTGKLCPRGGWTLVKVAKPNQDMRFDVPTIGPQTIEKVKQAGGVAIAIEAERTIVVDQAETIAAAERAGIAIVARSGATLGIQLAAA